MKMLVTLGKGQVRDSFFTPKVWEKLQAMGEVVCNETDRQAPTKEELKELIRDVDVVFTGWGTPALDAEVLECANKLRIHAHTGGSVASYISKEEYDRGITVLSGNDLFAKSVAEGCLCYTLMSLRRNVEFVDSMRNGGWRLENGWNKGLIGRKNGIVGYGAISRYYMSLLSWFEPTIYLASQYATEEELSRYGAKKATLEEIFSECDVISLHAAWNDDTEGMIDGRLLQMIRPGALLVNTARAQIIDQKALYQELATGRFQAVLDVYHQEPLPEQDILRKLPNVMLFPHMAGPSFDMREKVTLRLIEGIRAIENGDHSRDEIPYEYAKRMTVR